MKKVLILFGRSDWEKSRPFENKDYQYSYEFFYSICRENDIQMYRASYQWYDYTEHVFKHAWIYEGKGAQWNRVENVQPDLIYDKTKATQESYYFKDRIAKHYPIINHPTFSQIIDNKFIISLLFPQWSKKSWTIRNSMDIEIASKNIATKKVVIKPLSKSGGKDVVILEKKDLTRFSLLEESIIQEFIDSSSGIPNICHGMHDLRVVLVNDTVVYSYIRQPKEGSFLANLAQGGSLFIVPNDSIPPLIQPILQHANKIFDSFFPRIYSIDFMFDESGTPWVIELNSMPGLYFTPEEKPSMEKMYHTLLEVFQKKLISL